MASKISFRVISKTRLLIEVLYYLYTRTFCSKNIISEFKKESHNLPFLSALLKTCSETKQLIMINALLRSIKITFLCGINFDIYCTVHELSTLHDKNSKESFNVLSGLANAKQFHVGMFCKQSELSNQTIGKFPLSQGNKVSFCCIRGLFHASCLQTKTSVVYHIVLKNCSISEISSISMASYSTVQ